MNGFERERRPDCNFAVCLILKQEKRMDPNGVRECLHSSWYEQEIN